MEEREERGGGSAQMRREAKFILRQVFVCNAA